MITSKNYCVYMMKFCLNNVDPNNESDIINAVISLLMNSELREEMGKCSRARIVENFSYEGRKELKT